MDGGCCVTDELKHYGIRRKSGRYPWGSGDDDYTRSKDFYIYTENLKSKLIKEGVKPKEVDKELAKLIGQRTGDDSGFSIADLRDTRTIAKETIVREQTVAAQKLKAKKWSDEAIATNLGISIGTVRTRLRQSEEETKSSLSKTADILRKNVDEHDIVDIGKGVGIQMQLSNERLRAAASLLRDEGYVTHTIPQPQVGSKNATNQLVMVKPGVTWGEARRMADRVHTMGEWTEDNGKTFFGISTPLAVSSKRLLIKYAEDGGADEDGIVYVRPGVKDLDMGKNNYAQVRINIDNTHFVKGVAVLKDDIPDGYDLVFNSNKNRADGMAKALKPLKDDPENPFGSAIKKQIYDVDPKTGAKRLKSAMNIVTEEGDWDDWRLSLPSQMLAKQPHSLIKSQLGETQKQVRSRIDELNQITNPVVRKKALEDYAEQIDADAVDLRAASMPGQKTRLIIPVKSMSENEVYAPDYKTGDDVVLIRYPHGGRFEIPEVKVNNNHRAAKKLLGNAPDAIGISPKVAEKLSGADFDGDTVVVIPNPKGVIRGIRTVDHYYQKAFEGYDPKKDYGGYEVIGQRTKKDGTVEDIGNFKLLKNTGLEMGKITNLITDMQVQGAQADHVVRAVKHSMVVIDAEKHKLDYQRSAQEQGIAQLRELYQTTPGKAKPGGATTLLSKATAGETVNQLKDRPARQGGRIDKETGAVVRVETGKTRNEYDAKTGTYTEKKVPVQETYKRLALTDDAYTLVRDPKDPIERMYADHANAMKGLANSVRLQADRIPNPPINKKAREVYKEDIDKLTSDLKAAQATLPLQRRAQQYARQTVLMKRAEDRTLVSDLDRRKKVERQALAGARARLGLDKTVIDITDRQWDAIQAGGVSASKLREILGYAKPERITELSMPRKNTVMTSAVSARARAMLAAGATNAEVAASLGISSSTLRAAAARGDFQ